MRRTRADAAYNGGKGSPRRDVAASSLRDPGVRGVFSNLNPGKELE
jgi:hypothetical protein